MTAKDPYYQFVSHWHIPAMPTVVMDALLHDEDWGLWWKGLDKITVRNTTVGVGAQFDATWRSQSGYRLHHTVTVTDYLPTRRIAFTSTGDMVGKGDFAFEQAQGDVTDITIHWHVKTTKWWMNAFRPLLQSVFVRNHHRLMRAGEQGLIRYIERGN